MKKIDNKNMNKNDFIEFVGDLIIVIKENPNGWENNTLDSYLDALKSWVEDMDGYYENQNIELPQNIDWAVFANILIAATMYE